MATERHTTCQHWPDCQIHLGQPRPRQFSAANRAEMRADHAAGRTLVEIAAAFEASTHTVAAIVGGRRKREPAR